MEDVAHIHDARKAYARSDEWTSRGNAALARAYLDDGLSLRQLGDALGVSVETVRQRLVAQGVEMRSRGGRH